MNTKKSLLLIPCLTPLIAVLAISIFNLNKPVRLKLLTWTSPPISIGILMSIGGISGALIAGYAGFASTHQQIPLRRTVSVDPTEVAGNTDTYNSNIEGNYLNDEDLISNNNTPSPERDLREPTPTVTVPYKLIQKNKFNYHQNQSGYEKDSAQEVEDPYETPNKEDKIDVIDSNEDWGDNLNEKW